MKNLFSVFFVILFVSGQAQNLVPNGGFEIYSVCPNSTGYIFYASGWFQPHKYPGSNSVFNSSSSDYFNSCSNFGVNVPQNFAGFQFPKSGNGYAGIAYFAAPFNGNAFREYIEIELNQALVENKTYILKYNVVMANNSKYSVTRFDAVLTNDSLIHTSTMLNVIPATPQVQYYGRVDDTLNWVEIGGSFIANGGEKFLTIGNFHDGALSDTISTVGNFFTLCCAYYYIDDVSLIEDTTTAINEQVNHHFTMQPNPAKNVLQFKSQSVIQEIKLVSLQGATVLEVKPYLHNPTVDISSLVAGIYFVQCRFSNGAWGYKKLVVE